ncbi:uncharacterized protein LOC116608141 isoform X2 [Nematostella vectensis]|uniref:uncharacterized protein LOC116608141 isoform X2 n=1 Tax=Nematostella vectensis TaxID=45351 RepID=UPI0020773FAF|nr:uncharacterized protein LOC116608141 isoform X2 [Nematostella vectensis]
MEGSVSQCMMEISPSYQTTDLLHENVLDLERFPLIGNASAQPFAVTTLSLAACRLNDELLPKPLITTKHKDIQTAEPWPEHLRSMYTSHICKFDVFPRFDAARTKFDVPIPRKRNQKLSANTAAALERLSDNIYRTTHYQRTYPSWHAHRELPEIRKLEESSLEDEEDDEDDEEEKENTDLSEDIGYTAIIPHDMTAEDTKQTYGLQANANTVVRSLGQPRAASPQKLPNMKTLPEAATSQIGASSKESSKAKRPTSRPRPPSRLLTKRAWTPGRRTPFACRRAPTPGRRTPTPGRRASSRRKTRDLNSPQARPETRCDVTSKEDITLVSASLTEPSCLGYGDFSDNLPSLELIRLQGGGRMEAPSPGSRAEHSRWHHKRSLNATVGKKFKTDAHRKYHTKYPDLVPDLRDSTTSGKIHFFFGAHASYLR